MYVPVHPGRGLGRDGDHRWGGCGACGCGETFIIFPGAEGETRGYYDPRAFSGKTTLAANRDTVRSRALSELTLRQKPPQKRGRGTLASQPDDTTGILARACVHATLRFLTTPETA